MVIKNGYKAHNKYYGGWVHTADLPLESSDRDTVIQWLWDSELVQWYTTWLLQRDIEDEYVQDVIGELWVMICEIPQEKWDFLYAQGKMSISAYITGLIHQQVISTNSKIYNKLGRYQNTQYTKSEEWWNYYYYGENKIPNKYSGNYGETEETGDDQ